MKETIIEEKAAFRMGENNSKRSNKELISKIYKGEKTISLTSGAGETGQPPVQE